MENLWEMNTEAIVRDSNPQPLTTTQFVNEHSNI